MADPHRSIDLDRLQKLAEAVPHKDWERAPNTEKDVEEHGPYAFAKFVGAVAAVPKKSPQFNVADKYIDYIAAMNPATALALIARVREAEAKSARLWELTAALDKPPHTGREKTSVWDAHVRDTNPRETGNVSDDLIVGEGYVFFNPDAGEEYSRNHPIESGEVPDAEQIRRSTTQEDTLWQAFQAAESKSTEAAQRIREQEAENGRLRAGSQIENARTAHAILVALDYPLPIKSRDIVKVREVLDRRAMLDATTATTPAPQAAPDDEVAALDPKRQGIYIASKTHHAHRWKALRDRHNFPIISTWIDEAGPGESSCLMNLWQRCVDEAASAGVLVVYREPDEVLKGAWAEVGAALAAGVPVFAVGIEDFTIAHHANIKHFIKLDDALVAARAALEGKE